MLRRSAALVVATLSVSPAYADRTSAHATLTGDVALTDNVFSAPRANAEYDLFFELRPGLLFTFNRPRFIQELQGEAEVIWYLGHQSDPSLGGRGSYRAFITPGPRSEILLQVNAAKSVLSAINSRPSPDQTIVQVQPDVNVSAIQADGNEYGSWIATKEYRLSETLFGRYSHTDDQALPVDVAMDGVLVPANIVTRSNEVGGAVGIDRSWPRDAIGLELGASKLRLERTVGPAAPTGIGMGPRLDHQINPRGHLNWRHDYSRTISTSIDAGAVYVIPYGKDPYHPTDPHHRGVFPIAGGVLAYTEYWGVAQLSLRRDVTPNLFVAQNTVTDAGSISAAVPIPYGEDARRRRPTLVGLGSFGVQRTQLVDPATGGLASDFRAARLDLGVAYTVRPGVTYSARYELTYQSGDRSGVTQANGFFRNTIYFAFAVRYPDQVAVTVPRKRQNTTRADRKDQGGVGAEPVVPDLLDQAGEEGSDER